MQKRSQPTSQDMWSQGTKNYGKHRKEPDGKEDSSNNSLEYFISREKTIQVLKHKGIKYLYPIQQQTFRIIFQGSDLIARDRTGSGKTLAFVLPVIERFRKSKFQHCNPKFLIILPTRQLAMQVHNQIQSLRYKDDEDFKSYVVYGKTRIDDNVRKLKDGLDILVATPGRLNDLIERGAVRLDSLEVICLDEADQILKQGFKEQVEKVFNQIGKVNKKKIQTLLFSATIPQWLKDLSSQYQSASTPYINMINDDDIRTSKTIKHLSVEISRLEQTEITKLIEEMVERYGGYEKKILIFCEKKVDVDNLSRNLRIQNQPLHGDVAQFKRQRAYRDFKSGLLRCIVATNVAARGLDFPHVDLVIQMSPPLNTEQYIHRAGRTGRAGKEGTCLTFFDRTRSRIISKIQDEARITIKRISIDITSLLNSEKRYERDDRYNRNQREERGRNDKYERNDSNYRREENRREEVRKDHRQDRSSGHIDRERNASSKLFRQKIDSKWSQNRPKNFQRGQSRDPRPRSNYNQSKFKNDDGQRQKRGRSTSRSPKRGRQSRKSKSKSRSFSKQRSTTSRREISGSPKRSPDRLERPTVRKNSNQDSFDY